MHIQVLSNLMHKIVNRELEKFHRGLLRGKEAESPRGNFSEE